MKVIVDLCVVPIGVGSARVPLARGRRCARSSSPQGRDQGVGAVTLGQVAPLKRLAMRLLPSL
jgi:hypothetical protein